MKDEKKLKEMMASEKSDHDDVDMEIEELKAEIDRMIKGLYSYGHHQTYKRTRRSYPAG